MMFRSRAARRRSSLMAVSAIACSVALALAGCSSGTGSSSAGSATSGTVKWWGWSPQIEASKSYIAEFNKVYPNIKVIYKQFPTATYDAALRPALASSDGPDVFDVAPGGGIGSVNLYSNDEVDLAPVVEKALGSSWKSKLAPIGVTGLTTAGKLGGLPIGSTYAGSLWINPNYFQKYHLTPPKTLTEWVKDCAVFKSHGATCFEQGAADTGFDQDTLQAISDSVAPGLWTKAEKGQAKWTNPSFVTAFTIWKDMFSDGIMQPGALGVQQEPDVNNSFLGGQSAMVMMGTWFMQYATAPGNTAAVQGSGVTGAKSFPVIAIPFPDVAGKGNPATMFGDADYGLAVNAKSSVKSAAETFASWLTTSKEGQQTIANALNDIPSLNGLQPKWNTIKLVDSSTQQSNLQTLISDSGKSSEPRLSLVSASLGQAIGVAATTVAAGSATPAKALQSLQSTVGK